MIKKKDYPVVRTRPVARFFYRGRSHTHPVRRTVVLIETTSTHIRGFELREGSTVRSFKDAPIKTFIRKNIAKIGQVDRRRKVRQTAKNVELTKSTLVRSDLVNLVKEGA